MGFPLASPNPLFLIVVRQSKRYKVYGLRCDLSPISSKVLLGFSHPVSMGSLLAQSPHLRLTSLARIMGASRRSVERFCHSRPKCLERLRIVYDRVRLPLDLWFGGGRPLDPYVKGCIVWSLLSALEPKQIEVPPEEMYVDEEAYILAEYTIYREWTSEWLSWVKWYALAISNPDPRLEDLFNCPIITTNWKALEVNKDSVILGIQFKVFYDVVTKFDCFTVPQALEPLDFWTTRVVSWSPFWSNAVPFSHP